MHSLLRRCISRAFSSSKLADINTNVAKDVILFKYENPRMIRYLNGFAISQYLFWMYLATTAQTSLRDAPVDEATKNDPDARWYEKYNLGSPTYRRTLVGFSAIVGTTILAGSWMYTLKCVRYLVLHKGGKAVTFVTYTPFGQNRMMKVDLKYVSCQRSRNSALMQLPIKVDKTLFYYMLDMRGEFKNPTLFDHTAGLHRNFN